MTTAVEEEVKGTIFYCWAGVDAKGRAMPSGQAIHIRGGQKTRTTDGSVFMEPMVVAQFHNGMCATSDPEIIKVLRKKCGEGMGITEDREEYYRHVQTSEEQARRSNNQNAALKAELEAANQKWEEANRLIAKLQAQQPKTKARTEE
jgi:hypothetical protein